MKIGMVSLGCPKNLVDSEYMIGILKQAGHSIVPDSAEADVVIINTCGFINDAKEESINEILEAVNIKKQVNQCKYVVVTGCLAERYRSMIAEQIPEVDAILGTGSYDEIADTVLQLQDNRKELIERYGEFQAYNRLEMPRTVSTNGGSAYLKISEGCDNRCTYCIIPKLRGPHTSRGIEDILAEAVKLAGQGVTELILVAQDTTMYGKDLYGEVKLVELVDQLSDIKSIKWIRLLYCYPEEVTEEMIDLYKNNPKVCNYIDLPVQHASDRILKRMNRRTSNAQLRNLIGRLRDEVPGIEIRTTFIVGFPGESEEDFQILKDFVQEMQFDKMGVFVYSREEDTPAYSLKPIVHHMTAKKRHKELMLIQNEISREKCRNKIGKKIEVLIEEIADDGIFYVGRSYAETPLIDGRIYLTSQWELKAGQYVQAEILNNEDYDLIGEVKRQN